MKTPFWLAVSGMRLKRSPSRAAAYLRLGQMQARHLLVAVVCAAWGLLSAAPASAQNYALSVSTSPGRSGAVALQGAAFSGTAYVFTSQSSNLQNATPSGVTRVCYWLDSPSMTGTATHCEGAMPYDYAGSVDSTPTSAALPWSTAGMAGGSHTITQSVSLAAGGSEIDTASFTIQVPVTVSVTPTSASLLTNGMQQFKATVLNSSNTSVTWTATCGSISSSGLYTAAATSGVCSVLATSVADTTKSASASVSVNTAAVPSYALSVSASPDHSAGFLLQGTALSGSAYVFTSVASNPQNYDPAGIARVCYWLDNTSMTGAATHCEGTMPYDYIGSVNSTASSAALPWSTASVASGSHTITQAVTLSSGSTEVESATFTIGSVVQLSPVAFSASPTMVATGQSATLAWSASNAVAVSIDNGIGSVATTGTLTVTPAASTTYTLTATSANGTASTQSLTVLVSGSTAQHYEYVFPDGDMFVYDIDNGFKLVKHVSLPQTTNIRGVAVLPATHMLYISYGGNGGAHGNGSLLKYDLLTDSVVWRVNYPFGIDSFAITPDGLKLYMPEGDAAAGDTWYIIDPVSGSVTGSIHSGQTAPHNTIVSLDGSQVFMGSLWSCYLAEASTVSDTVVGLLQPLLCGIRPFTINGKHTLAFTTITNVLGFQVENAVTGANLFQVSVPGYSIPSGFESSHGISLSPDEREIYVIDTANVVVHVFDVSGLPATAPVALAHIPISNNFSGVETLACVYDCSREGWLQHSRDGRYVFVGDAGNVIDTRTRQVVATLSPLANTRKFLEVDWQSAAVISTTTRHGVGYVTK